MIPVPGWAVLGAVLGATLDSRRHGEEHGYARPAHTWADLVLGRSGGDRQGALGAAGVGC